MWQRAQLISLPRPFFVVFYVGAPGAARGSPGLPGAPGGVNFGPRGPGESFFSPAGSKNQVRA